MEKMLSAVRVRRAHCIFTCYATYVHAHGEQWSKTVINRANAHGTMRNSARARKISKEQMLSTMRLAKSKALVATYLQLTKSFTV